MQHVLLKNKDGYPFTNRDLLRMILPAIAELLLVNMVGIVDSIMVSVIGEEAISAVSLVDTTYALLTVTMTALSSGAAIVCGHFLGSGKEKQASDTMDQLFLLTAVVSILLSILLLLTRGPILMLLYGQITPLVRYNADVYMVVVAFSMPFLSFYNAGAAMFRMMEDTATPMKMSILMNGIHIPLNAILLYGFRTGIEGAAISTFFSRAVCGILMILLLRKETLPMHLAKKPCLTFSWEYLKRILHLGIPQAIESLLFQSGTVLILSMVSAFGTAAIAANAVSNTVMIFQTIPCDAIRGVLVILSAHCVGAKRYDYAKYYVKKILMWSYVVGVAVNLLIIALIPGILSMYHLSSETGALATGGILIVGIATMTLWNPGFELPALLWAAEDVRFCLLHSLACVWGIRVLFSYILGVRLGMGILGVKYAIAADWAVRFVVVILRYRQGKWMQILQ